MEMTGPGLSIIRACSEALLFGVVNCLKNDSSAREVIRQNFNPSIAGMHIKTPTKLLLCVFTGGKAIGSLVKFSKFYLVIDGFSNPDTNILHAFSKFMNALKKNMSTVKGGDAAFKLGPGVATSMPLLQSLKLLNNLKMQSLSQELIRKFQLVSRA